MASLTLAIYPIHDKDSDNSKNEGEECHLGSEDKELQGVWECNSSVVNVSVNVNELDGSLHRFFHSLDIGGTLMLYVIDNP